MGVGDGRKRPEHAAGARRALTRGQGQCGGTAVDVVLTDDVYVDHVNDHRRIDDIHDHGGTIVVDRSLLDDVHDHRGTIVVDRSLFDDIHFDHGGTIVVERSILIDLDICKGNVLFVDNNHPIELLDHPNDSSGRVTVSIVAERNTLTS